MKRNKQIAALVALIATLFSCIVGCGQKSDYTKMVPSTIFHSYNLTEEKATAAKTDVVRLGSPIRIETTVRQGWDKDEQEIMDAIRSAVEDAGVKDGMSQKEAIQKINDFLCEYICYSEGTQCRTIRGALIERRAVCVGYTLAFMYMAHYCGINAVYVHGRTTDSAHAWNGVYFSDGTYLEVDVTMNDTSGKFHKYLLLTPEEMEALHFW